MRAVPATDPLVVERGDLVRMRLGNLSANNHHPIYLDGHHFNIVATDRGDPGDGIVTVLPVSKFSRVRTRSEAMPDDA